MRLDNEEQLVTDPSCLKTAQWSQTQLSRYGFHYYSPVTSTLEDIDIVRYLFVHNRCDDLSNEVTNRLCSEILQLWCIHRSGSFDFLVARIDLCFVLVENGTSSSRALGRVHEGFVGGGHEDHLFEQSGVLGCKVVHTFYRWPNGWITSSSEYKDYFTIRETYQILFLNAASLVTSVGSNLYSSFGSTKTPL